MALDKAVLKTKLIQVLSSPNTTSNVEKVASSLADAIDAFVKSGDVITTVTGHSTGKGKVI